MPMLDISKVSETLRTLLERHVEASLAVIDPSATNDIDVVIDPPDGVTGQGDTLSLHLYHLTENLHFKNQAPPGPDQPPIRYTPMGLDLFYQVTAHAQTTAREQTLMGLAVKALRDYPIIDDSTDFGGPILDGDLRDRDNRIRIDLQPIPPNEAVSYWTAGSAPLRLAAYYQVSIALLEPEEIRSRTGRVLFYNVDAFASGTPRLDYSTNPLFFFDADAIGAPSPERRLVEPRPAQVPFVADGPLSTNPKPRNGDIALVGSDLSATTTTLRLVYARWDEPIEADASWDVSVTDTRIEATVRKTIGAPPTDVLPGPYAAFVRRVDRRSLPDGSPRDIVHLSNHAPFMVTPRIDTIAGTGINDATQPVDITGWIFDYTDPNDPAYALDVEVYLGSSRLVRNQTGALVAGEFRVIDAQTLRFVRSAEIQSEPDEVVLLRIFVNGAEAPPHWVKTP